MYSSTTEAVNRFTVKRQHRAPEDALTTLRRHVAGP
jgi:hypothetical protein